MVEMAVYSTAFLSLQGFTAGLVSAVCEWFLIFLLLIDAFLSYLLTQFSIYCELPAPCILCSRLDHIFGKEKPGFYRSLFCANHRSEISYLVNCEIHGKLADGCCMCENCVLSSVKKTKPNSDMHRLLLSRMGLGLGSHDEAYGFQSSFYKGKHTPTYQSPRMCLCCNVLWTPKPNFQSPLQLKSPAAGVAKPNISLPRHLSRGSSRRFARKVVDPLSHVGYTEVKINSEQESEFPFTDDDDLSSIVPDFDDKEESLVHYFATGSQPKRVDKMILSNSNKNPEAKHLAHVAAEETVLSKIKPHQTASNANNTEFAEFISLHDMPSSSSAVEVPVAGSSLSQNSFNPAVSDFLSSVHTSPTINSKEVPQASRKMYNAETSNNDGSCTGTKLETDQAANNPAEIDLAHGNPGDIHKAAISDEESDGIKPAAEQPNMKQTNEDMNSIQGKNSLGQETHSSWNNSSQAFKVQGNEPDGIHRSYSDEARNTYASVSPDRTDTGFDSFDISSVSEVEGESIVDRLRRQVQRDRMHIKVLHKELEEERSAAAVAANQALAMISKLQEEKSALQMEAHQYLRMMEEQSEHDAEELEKANELLVEKEKEIQDLETELDYYRLHYGDDSLIDENVLAENAHVHEVAAQTVPLRSNNLEENVPVQNTSAPHKRLEPVKVTSNDLEEGNATVERKSVSFKKDEVHVCSKPKLADRSVDSDKSAVALSDIEEEKASILLRLKSLEKKFRQVADPSSPYTPESVRRTGAVEGRHQKREFTDENGEVRILVVQNGPSKEIDIQGPECKATTSSEEALNSLPSWSTMGNDRSDRLVSSSGEDHDDDDDDDDDSIHDLFTIQSEILELNQRFEALESKYNFLDRSSSSSQNANEGRKFIREMDVQLQELRRLVSMTRF